MPPKPMRVLRQRSPTGGGARSPAVAERHSPEIPASRRADEGTRSAYHANVASLPGAPVTRDGRRVVSPPQVLTSGAAIRRSPTVIERRLPEMTATSVPRTVYRTSVASRPGTLVTRDGRRVVSPPQPQKVYGTVTPLSQRPAGDMLRRYAWSQKKHGNYSSSHELRGQPFARAHVTSRMSPPDKWAPPQSASTPNSRITDWHSHSPERKSPVSVNLQPRSQQQQQTAGRREDNVDDLHAQPTQPLYNPEPQQRSYSPTTYTAPAGAGGPGPIHFGSLVPCPICDLGSASSPTLCEVKEFANFLQIDPERERNLMWIAEMGIRKCIPSGWAAHWSPEGDLYYHNSQRQHSVWDIQDTWPRGQKLDGECRELLRSERAKLASEYRALDTESSFSGTRPVRPSPVPPQVQRPSSRARDLDAAASLATYSAAKNVASEGVPDQQQMLTPNPKAKPEPEPEPEPEWIPAHIQTPLTEAKLQECQSWNASSGVSTAAAQREQQRQRRAAEAADTQREQGREAAAAAQWEQERQREAARAAAAEREQQRQHEAAEAAAAQRERLRQREAAEEAAALREQEREAVAAQREQERQREAAEAMAAQREQERQREAAEAAAAQREQERQRKAAEAAAVLREQEREAVAAAQREHERQREAAEAAAAQREQERQREAAEAVAAAQREQERQREAAEAVAAQREQERQRKAAEAAAAQREQERQRKAAEAAAALQEQEREAVAAAQREQERQREAAEAVSAQREQERQRKSAEAAAALREQEREAAEEAAALREQEREAVAAAQREQERQREAAEAVAAQREQERQRKSAEAAAAQREQEREAAAAPHQAQQRQHNAAAAEQDQERHVGKDKEWSDMTLQERDAVCSLGWSEATWTHPESLKDAEYPLHRPWSSLTAVEQSAASTLGFQHSDFGSLEDHPTVGTDDLESNHLPGTQEQVQLRRLSVTSDESDDAVELFSIDVQQDSPGDGQMSVDGGANAGAESANTPGKDKDWSDMTTQERQAVKTLGFTEFTWTNPDLLNPAEDPFEKNWRDLSQRQQAAASVLGLSEPDWEENDGGENDGEGTEQQSAVLPDEALSEGAAEQRKRDMLAKFAGLSARDSFRLSGDAFEVDWGDDGDLIKAGKEKNWSEMTQQERDAVTTLGFSEATWTTPELLDDSKYPLYRAWSSLTMAEQSAASSLGYQPVDFQPLDDSQQDGEI